MNEVYLIPKDELYHYGVKGMKCGHRKNPEIALAKANYKTAKKELKTATRNAYRIQNKAYGIKGMEKLSKAKKEMGKAEIKALDAKAAYKVSKARNEKQAVRAEFNTYKKGMGGIRGSYNDTSNNDRATRVYNHLAVKKGKKYADRIEKRIQNEAYATLAASAAVTIGYYATQMYRLNKY